MRLPRSWRVPHESALHRVFEGSGPTTEIENLSVVLKWAQQREVRNFRDLSTVFEDYRAHSKEVYQGALDDLGKAGLVMQAEMREGFKL